MKATIPSHNMHADNCKEIEVALDASECADAVPVLEIHVTNHDKKSRTKGKKAKFFVDVRVFNGRPFVLVRAFTPSGKKTPRATRCTGNFVINVDSAHKEDMNADTNLKFSYLDPCPNCDTPLTHSSQPGMLFCKECAEYFALSKPDGKDIEDHSGDPSEETAAIFGKDFGKDNNPEHGNP